jgi:feruloyl esterase
MRLFTSIITAAFTAQPFLATAQQFPQPTLKFLYTENGTLGEPWTVGDTGFGNRVVVPITGGTFSGPRMSGTVTNLGADWGVTDSRDVFFADTRYNLRTDDGADIIVSTYGPMQPDGKVFLRTTYQTGHPDYEWLNYIVAMGVLEPTSTGVTTDVWQVSWRLVSSYLVPSSPGQRCEC